jgi:uncharacterized protein YggE
MPDVRQLVTTAAVAVLAIAGYQAVHDTSTAPAASSPRASGMLQPFMRFAGSGTTTMRPDQGTISFSTHGTGDTLLDAQNQASQAMQALIAKLNADGVPGIEMQTNGVQGYQRHGLSGGYAADQSLTVTVRDVSKIGKLLADGAATGAQSSSGVDFSTNDQRRSYNTALRAAIGDARSKADAVAAAAGLHVSGVVSVDETQASQPYYGLEFSGEKAAAQGAVSVPIKRGTQQMSAQVTVVFAYTD